MHEAISTWFNSHDLQNCQVVVNLPEPLLIMRSLFLYGMPHIECASVLAHEYAHIWLNERFIEDSPPVVEGFCNLVSEAILLRGKGKLASIIREI